MRSARHQMLPPPRRFGVAAAADKVSLQTLRQIFDTSVEMPTHRYFAAEAATSRMPLYGHCGLEGVWKCRHCSPLLQLEDVRKGLFGMSRARCLPAQDVAEG